MVSLRNHSAGFRKLINEASVSIHPTVSVDVEGISTTCAQISPSEQAFFDICTYAKFPFGVCACESVYRLKFISLGEI